MELPFKTEHQLRVEQLMTLAGQDVPLSPTWPSEGIRRLRARLILEEAIETVRALGFNPKVPVSEPSPKDGMPLVIDDILFVPRAFNPDIEDLYEVVDGCCDLSVVAIGTLSAFGVPDDPCLNLVDSNNLDKFGPGSRRRDDGKWMKPPDHQPPDWQRLFLFLDSVANPTNQPSSPNHPSENQPFIDYL